MSNPSVPPTEVSPVPDESFGDVLSQFERTHARPTEAGQKSQQIGGTVIAVSAETVYVDIRFKTEGILPLASFTDAGQAVAVGDKLTVSVRGRDPEGYYELSRARVEQPKDWGAMEKAFAERTVVGGTVTGVVKGGLTVDVGMRAFLPASRSGVRDAAEMERLVGQEIRCRITKLDTATDDVVVDRRGVLEEEDRLTKDRRYAEVKAGDTLSGTVRSLTDYGAFIDLGGLDGLLHIGEISWSRVSKAEDVLTVGEPIEVKVIKIEPETRRISLSRRQLLPHPWEAAPERFKVGDRVRGTVTRLTDFGAFLELEPGIEGMIHISEMSWGKKVRKPGDLLKVGDAAEVVILRIDLAEHRLALGLKQALGDPWIEAADRFAAGSVVEGEVTSFTPFGAFVQISEGIQGMVHISEIVADRRLNHPTDVLRVGEQVKAKVLEFDREKRQLRLSIKGMVPTGLDDFLAEHKMGDVVTGRIVSIEGEWARVELGEGIPATCALPAAVAAQPESSGRGKVDLLSLSSMLHARWKTGATAASSGPAEVAAGQVRRFRIAEMGGEAGGIALRLAE